MNNLEAQKYIVFWLTNVFYKENREEILRRVDPIMLDDPYKSVFLSFKNFYTDKRPLSELEYVAECESLKSDLSCMPYDLDVMLKVVAAHHLEKTVSDGLSGVFDGTESAPDLMTKIQNTMRDIYKTTDVQEKTAIRDVLVEVLELEGGGDWGLKTGYSEVDALTGGLRKGAFWLLGGYANVGKTGFVVRMADYLCSRGKNVFFYSLEMNRGAVGKKLIDYIAKHRKEASPYDIAAEYKLQVINQKRTVEQLERHAMSQKDKPDAIIIDYLHLLGVESIPKNSDEYARVSAISSALKNFAQTSEVPIVALSQISNESAKKEGFGGVIGFKGSGSLAFDCDVGLILKRDYDLEGENLKVPIHALLYKNRYGEAPRDISMVFNKLTGFIL